MAWLLLNSGSVGVVSDERTCNSAVLGEIVMGWGEGENIKLG